MQQSLLSTAFLLISFDIVLRVHSFSVGTICIHNLNRSSPSSSPSLSSPATATIALHQSYARHVPKLEEVKLQMGLLDFFQSRENDFVKLEKTSTYGPGPILILYNVPPGIADDEIKDMIDDGMGGGDDGKDVKFVRLDSSDLEFFGSNGGGSDPASNSMTVSEVLEKIIADELQLGIGQGRKKNSGSDADISFTTNGVPILYFSGISNAQMMKTYNIIAREIYEETGGAENAACAKVVEPAMSKPFRQVIEEISGDHTDALQAS